jgi:RNA polymerase sigma factor (TIGR02999 family)
MAQPPDVTGLLVAWSHGDADANDRLIEAVYAELRGLARGYLRRERPDHSLAPTALVREAYLRLVDQRRVQWHNRVHLFAIAAHMMRRLLVDHARAHGAAKRGAGHRVPCSTSTLRSSPRTSTSPRWTLLSRGWPHSIDDRAAWWSCASSED